MSERASVGGFLFSAGDEAWVTCHTYRDRTPILAFYAPSADLRVTSVSGRGQVTDGDLRFAESFAEAATAYLADTQRLHAEQSRPVADDPSEGSEAA
ncbi:hypothetical protein ACFOVU_18120 [Nocardiopsis sediminis]|uniref:Uncharacterized protein n=1 Tax=Nocardiopsis sediminis TaxID=1778267 RepID=A0ABV8FS86_9ACTN